LRSRLLGTRLQRLIDRLERRQPIDPARAAEPCRREVALEPPRPGDDARTPRASGDESMLEALVFAAAFTHGVALFSLRAGDSRRQARFII
jgi:hypothetical protein